MKSSDRSDRAIAKGIYLLPNLLTIGALFAGFYAVVAAMKHLFDTAAIAVFIAMIFDGLDGRVARLTQSESDFGAQFDSLSDMVCFGIAPALILYTWSLDALGKPGWLVAFMYAACTALRLARFNTQVTTQDKRYFQGLSTTAAAGFTASFIWTCTSYGVNGRHYAVLIAILTAMVALLKVSVVRYRSFKDLDVRDKVPFIVMIILVLALILISTDPPDMLLFLFGCYVVSGPIAVIWRRTFKRGSHEDEL